MDYTPEPFEEEAGGTVRGKKEERERREEGERGRGKERERTEAKIKDLEVQCQLLLEHLLPHMGKKEFEINDLSDPYWFFKKIYENFYTQHFNKSTSSMKTLA